ncbi:MAG: hypothetical protein JSW47_05835, partial [Phycisphaerales bacterium]
ARDSMMLPISLESKITVMIRNTFQVGLTKRPEIARISTINNACVHFVRDSGLYQPERRREYSTSDQQGQDFSVNFKKTRFLHLGECKLSEATAIIYLKILTICSIIAIGAY